MLVIELMANTEIPSDRLVVQSNKLIEARHLLTAAEMRLMLKMVSMIDRQDEDFKRYRIYIKDFAQDIGTKHKGNYARARSITKGMLKRVLEIQEDDELLQVSLLSAARYKEGRGYVEVSFHPDLKPYLLQLKQQFTSYDIKNILTLQSGHSLRIYQLLKQYAVIGNREISLTELKTFLGIEDRYKGYHKFKQRVLLQAQRELDEQCDITFTFDEIKARTKGRGKKPVEAIRFKIQRRQAALPAIQADHAALVEALRKIKISEKHALAVLREYPVELVAAWVAYTKQRLEEGKISKSAAGYCLDGIKGGALPDGTLAQTPKPAKQEQKPHIPDDGEALYQEYREWHGERITALVEQAGEDERNAFEKHAASDSLLRGQILKNGTLDWTSRIVEAMFRNFLADTHNIPADTDESFQSWAYTTKGIGVQKTGFKDGKPIWQVTSKQEQMFA